MQLPDGAIQQWGFIVLVIIPQSPQSRPMQQLVMKLNCIAAGHEDNNLAGPAGNSRAVPQRGCQGHQSLLSRHLQYMLSRSWLCKALAAVFCSCCEVYKQEWQRNDCLERSIQSACNCNARHIAMKQQQSKCSRFVSATVPEHVLCTEARPGLLRQLNKVQQITGNKGALNCTIHLKKVLPELLGDVGVLFWCCRVHSLCHVAV